MNAIFFTLGLSACAGGPLLLLLGGGAALAPASPAAVAAQAEAQAADDDWADAIEAEIEAAMEAFERDMEAYERDMEAYARDMEAHEADMDAYERDMEAYERDVEAYEREMEARECELDAVEDFDFDFDFDFDDEGFPFDQADCEDGADCESPAPKRACGETGVSLRVQDANGSLAAALSSEDLHAALERLGASHGEMKVDVAAYAPLLEQISVQLADLPEVQAEVERALAKANGAMPLVHDALARAEVVQQKAGKAACKAREKAEAEVAEARRARSLYAVAGSPAFSGRAIGAIDGDEHRSVVVVQDGERKEIVLDGDGPHVLWIDDEGEVRVSKTPAAGASFWSGGSAEGHAAPRAFHVQGAKGNGFWSDAGDGRFSFTPFATPAPPGAPAPPAPPAPHAPHAPHAPAAPHAPHAPHAPSAPHGAGAPSPAFAPFAAHGGSSQGGAELGQVLELLREVQAELRDLRASVHDLRDDMRASQAR